MPLSKIVANSITDNTITTDQIAVNSVHGRRNLVINGSFAVSQRATSVTGVAGDGYHAVDRFKTAISSAGTFTVSQAADGPSGFSTCHKFDCTTAKSSLDAGNYILFFQTIEARNLQSLGFGSSGAKQITLSFYVKSNKTGTYIAELALGDATNASNNSQAYTISSANTWERKTLTYAAQTVDVINNDSGEGMNIFFWLGAGSQWSSGTLNPNVWANTTSANRAVGQVNLADSTSNEWLITGVQLEIGDKATPFEHRSFGEELHDCKRYFQKSFNYDDAPANGSSTGISYNGGILSYCGSNNNGALSGFHRFNPEMRATPSIVTYGNSSGYWGRLSPTNTGTTTFDAGSGYMSNIKASGINFGQNASGDTLLIGFGHITASAEL